MSQKTIAGALMMLGASVILVSIFFEFQVGWIGVARDASDMPGFIHANWAKMKIIWSWQMLGHAVLAVAYLLMLRCAPGPAAALWAATFAAELLVIIAFGLTLGGYLPALEVLETQPVVFEVLRGSVRALYSPGGLGAIALFSLIFLVESFASNGAVGRVRGLATLAVFALCLGIGAVTALTVKVTGAAWFLLPFVMGYSLARER